MLRFLRRPVPARPVTPCQLAALLLLAALAACAIAPAAAHASTTYDVEDCGTYGNTSAFGFARSNTAFTGSAPGCASGSGQSGLELGLSAASSANVALGDRSVWQFDAPAGETISGLGIENGTYLSDDGWISGWAANSVINPNPLPPADACTAQPQTTRCSHTSSGWFPIAEAHDIELMLRCDEVSSARTTYCAANSSDASASIGAAVIQLTDPTDPNVAVSGGLWDAATADALGTRWISGLNAGSGLGLDFAASNPAGICTLRATLTDPDGNVVASSTETSQTPTSDAVLGQRLGVMWPFASALPCGGSDSGAGNFSPDLSALPTGTYRVNVEAQDPGQYETGQYTYAAGSTLAAGARIDVDNSVPRVVVTPPGADSAGSPETIAVEAADSAGSSGLASLICDVEGNERTYPVSGDDESVTVPLDTDSGDGGSDRVETVRCRATSVAGNVSAPASLTLTRAPTTFSATLSGDGHRIATVAEASPSGALRLGYGQSATLSGRLATAGGVSPGGAQVLVEGRVAGESPTRVAQVSADSSGRFSVRIPAGPSRELMLFYGGSPTLLATAAQGTISVAGSVGLTVPRRPRARHPLTISGRVRGGHLPSGGVLVQLWFQARGSRSGWEPFERVIRTSPSGSFHLSFPVAGGAAGHIYRLKAVVAAQAGWPFSRAASSVVTRRFR